VFYWSSVFIYMITLHWIDAYALKRAKKEDGDAGPSSAPLSLACPAQPLVLRDGQELIDLGFVWLPKSDWGVYVCDGLGLIGCQPAKDLSC
jgi:hypothetical protein